MAQPSILIGSRSRDQGEDSGHLRHRHQVDPLETYDDDYGWILSPECIEAVRKLNYASKAETGQPKTDYDFRDPLLWTAMVKVVAMALCLGSLYPWVWAYIEVPAELRCSSLVQDEHNISQTIYERDQFDPSTSDLTAKRPTDGNQQPDDRCAPANLAPSYDQEIESLPQQTPGHSRNAHRVTVCHALIGTSIVGVATSLSLALWWSFAHGDPGSGFTVGSYVLAVFGVLVGIPGYRHSKTCQCWESKPKGA